MNMLIEDIEHIVIVVVVAVAVVTPVAIVTYS